MRFIKYYKKSCNKKLELVTPFPSMYKNLIEKEENKEKTYNKIMIYAISIVSAIIVLSGLSSIIGITIAKAQKSSNTSISLPNKTDPNNYPVSKWEELSNYEKYFEIQLNNIRYIAMLEMEPIDENYVGEFVSICNFIGYDLINDIEKMTEAKVFKLKDFELECCVCGKFEDDSNYYLYMNSQISFNSPEDLFNKLSLPECINFNSVFAEQINFYEDGRIEKKEYHNFEQEEFLNFLFSDSKLNTIQEYNVTLNSYTINLAFDSFNNPAIGGKSLFRIDINSQNEILLQMFLGNYIFKAEEDVYSIFENLISSL